MNGKKLKFVSVRMAETQLLSNYLHYLHADIYTCTSVRSHFITDSEANILNEINIKHCDGIYGKDRFYAGKDCIVRLKEFYEFYNFLTVCYSKLTNNFPCHTEICGFMRIDSELIIPYSVRNNQKYIPLFYLEGETENLKHHAIYFENWNLAYLKFCCKLQCIKNELLVGDSCKVISLDDIKNYFPPDTRFEEYWPPNVIDSQLLINQKSTHVNPPSIWIRPPPECTISHSSTASAPVMPQSMSMVKNTFQNRLLPNQMVCIMYSVY